ncbi:hypothetical protein P261_01801 [Lachnospiraceae bacterium TWA4]|nr:hypothetical protein P261_01801 [Lachnospiraceae bacterium TWA4]
MNQISFPVIDPIATGANILRLRKERGLSVRDLQGFFGFEEPQAIYKWQRGQSLPSVDNLYALGALLQVPMDEILVSINYNKKEQCASAPALSICLQHSHVDYLMLPISTPQTMPMDFSTKLIHTYNKVFRSMFSVKFLTVYLLKFTIYIKPKTVD